MIGPPTQPTAPLEIVALGPHSIMVEWGAPESDGGAPLEGYKVAVRDAKRHMWMEVGRVAADIQKLKVQELAVSFTRYYMASHIKQIILKGLLFIGCVSEKYHLNRLK